ncbi:MAG: hypothetical protein M1537_08110 [Nitrospirae bacterium]|nr:hypothetical protein [Nitrospirota bacterium]MCL5285885.1 hypothetical protein [Nitrospirota bacterium]
MSYAKRVALSFLSALMMAGGLILLSPGKSPAAVLPLSLSVQGIGIGVLSGQSSLTNSVGGYTGGGFGAGFLATLHLLDNVALRGQANYLHFTGTPLMTAFPVTLGLEYDFLHFTDLFYFYGALDAGYNNTQAEGTGGNNFTWDAALGLNLGPVYAEIRYAQISGPLVTTSQGSLGSLSYVPVVVGFTFF